MAMMFWNDGLGTGGWIAMTVVMVLFWGLVVVAGAAIFRDARDTGPASRPPDRNPTEILDDRFARGEIDADEYNARSSALRAAH